MVKVEDKARTQTKGPRALCGSSRPGGWMGGWGEGALRPCSLQLVPQAWEHTASGPAYTLSPDGLTRVKAKVLLLSWGGQGC